MTIRSRPYVDEDLHPLQAILADWIKETGGCGYYHVGNLPHWIYGILRGRRPAGELVQIWEDGARIIGIAISSLFGMAFHVFASPSRRGTGAELEMLQSAYEATRRCVDETEGKHEPVEHDASNLAALELYRSFGFRKKYETLGYRRH